MRLGQSGAYGASTNRKTFICTPDVQAYAALRTNGPDSLVVTNTGTFFTGITLQPAPLSAQQPWANSYVSPGSDPGAAGTVALGTARRIAAHKHRIGDIYEAEWSQADADLVSPSGPNVGTAIPFAANSASLAGGWLYVVSGTGLRQLRYIASSILNTSITVASALTVAVGVGSRILVIPPLNARDLILNATGVSFVGDPALTSTNGFILHETRFSLRGSNEELTPIGAGSELERGTAFLAFDFVAGDQPVFEGFVSPSSSAY